MNPNTRLVGFALLAIAASACGQSNEEREKTTPVIEGAADPAAPGGKAQPDFAGLPSGQATPDGSDCTADEIDSVEACVGPACPGLTGAGLIGCALEFCGPQVNAVSGICLACLADGAGGGVEGLANACGPGGSPPPPPDPACTSSELGPIEACVQLQCGRLQGQSLVSCALGLCEAVVLSASDDCGTCLMQNASGGFFEAANACGG